MTPPVERGFTLSQLLITLAVTTLLITLALPAFQRLQAANAMTATRQLLLGHLLLARSTAIQRERPVVLCPAPEGGTCIQDHRLWNAGYLVFVDENLNRQADPGEPVVAVGPAAPSGIRIQTTSQQRNRILFLPSGRNWFSNTTLSLCHERFPQLNRALILSGNGHVRSAGADEARCP